MFTAQQQALLRYVDLREPEPFLHADFKRPFVYDPKWGVFYCRQHPTVMATLAAIHLGEPDIVSAAKHLGLPDCFYSLADYWLEHYHGCYKSSASTHILTWDKHSLKEWEQAIIHAAHRNLLFQGK